MDLQTKRLMEAAAGAGGDPIYINDYFNMFGYEGNSANRSIVTNIDMTDGKSMVWIKNRTSDARHNNQDTERGAGKLTKIGIGQAKAQNTGDHADHWAGYVSAFNNNGFSLEKDGTGTDDWTHVNKDNDDYIAWTFKACKGFFDIVTFSTDGTVDDNNRRISHGLEAVPGVIWVKRLTGTDTGYDYHWNIYHRNNGRGKYQRPGEMPVTSSNAWGTSDPTTTDFGIKESVLLDANSTYIAYVFAAGDSDAEVFGEGQDQEVIKCGSIGMSGTNNVNTGSNGECSIDLGWEPDFILLQGTEYQYNGAWRMFDRMRGVDYLTGATSTSQWAARQLRNAWNDEDLKSSAPGIRFTSTGFDYVYGGISAANNNGMVWMAIRKADGYVGKPPTGTDAFHIASGNFNSGPPAFLSNNFPVEFAIEKDPVNVQNMNVLLRDMGHYRLAFNNDAQRDGHSDYGMDWGNGIMNNNLETDYKAWMWRSGPGIDVVFAVGTGNNGHSISHNLNAVPEMIFAKNLEKTDDWMVYHKGLNGGTTPHNYYVRTNNTGGEVNSAQVWGAAPTATTFTIGNDGNINESSDTSAFILLSSVEGFSKVGSYTGNGSTQSITCGFSPKMVIIKSRSTNPMMMLDTVRGWGSGDDYALKFTDPWGHTHTGPPDNNQDFGAPTSTGFDLTSNSWPNANNTGYIYYAVA